MENQDNKIETPAEPEVAEKKTDWVNWVKDKIGDHPATNNKFGLMAQEYAWYRGDQYRVWDQRLGVLRNVNIARETRSVRNICRPLVDMFVSKFLKGDPEPRFRPYPDNTEDNDQSLSVIGNGMTQYWWRTAVRGSAKLRHQAQWGGITGLMASKVYYDKNKVSGNYTGEIEWETVNPFHLFVNPDARTDDEIRWAIHRFPKDKNVVEDQFGLERDSLQGESKSDGENMRVSGGMHVDEYVIGEDEGTVFVHDIWLRACKDYPNGKHVIVAADKKLIEEDNPEPDSVPFFTSRVKGVPDEIYGEGVLKNVLPIQRDVNRMESIVVGNSSAFGNAKILLNRAAGIIDAQINNEESGKIYWDGQIEPKLLQGAIVPSHIVNWFWDSWRKALNCVGFTEVGRGDIPFRGSQTQPGVVRELKQSEEVNFAPDVAEGSDYINRIMRRVFKLMRKYYVDELGQPEARIVDIVGDDKRPEAIYFVAQKFVKDPDFDIPIGSGFSQSQEARIDQIIQFAQTGIFDRIPGIDWSTIGKEILDYAGLNKISKSTFRDEKQAKRNLQNILMGNDVPLSPYANLPVHIKVFRDYINDPEYEYLEIEQKASIDRYIGTAQMLQQQQMMQQMMMQRGMMLPPGINGGPGNNKPQPPTGTEQAEANANRRTATGQPVNDMEQGGNQPPLPGA